MYQALAVLTLANLVTLRLLREQLFEETLGWQHGVQFQIVSFQAVMADLLGGDTIHNALGLDWNGDSASNVLRACERARHALQWRWLILDRFSMVSAEPWRSWNCAVAN